MTTVRGRSRATRQGTHKSPGTPTVWNPTVYVRDLPSDPARAVRQQEADRARDRRGILDVPAHRQRKRHRSASASGYKQQRIASVQRSLAPHL